MGDDGNDDDCELQMDNVKVVPGLLCSLFLYVDVFLLHFRIENLGSQKKHRTYSSGSCQMHTSSFHFLSFLKGSKRVIKKKH